MAAKTTTLAVVSSCLLLAHQLLLLAPATTATSIPVGGGGGGATASSTVPVSSHRDSDDADADADVPPFFRFPGGSGAAAGCWNAVLRAEVCAGDVLRSVASLLLHDGERHPWGVHVGAPCCGVLQAVGDRCFRDLLTDSPFRPLYAPLVNHVCGALPVGGGVTPIHRH
uniref:Prolamin-like domain-containing protein n=1 Tax=Oryza meridionalis TaxID=40149 RepID=A0A0E0D3E4_9ORYZ